MSDKNHATKNVTGRWLEIDEVRLVSDLRIMHANVDELCLLVQNLRHRHDEAAIYNYADHLLLQENNDRVDQIYLWFVALKQEARKKLA